MKTIHVEVTQEDIDHGKRDNCLKCPLALALMRACGAEIAHAGSYFGVVKIRDCYQSFVMPLSARSFIGYFDDGAFVSPFAFDIEVDL